MHLLRGAFVDAYVTPPVTPSSSSCWRSTKTYRAYVRAKINSFAADDAHIPDGGPRREPSTASRYYELAAHYAATCNPRRLIVTCGLTGTVKAPWPQARRAVRPAGDPPPTSCARAAGLAPVERRVASRTTRGVRPRMTGRTYSRCWSAPRRCSGWAVSGPRRLAIPRDRNRQGAVELARRMSVPFLLLECPHLPRRGSASGLSAGPGKNGTVSDGRWEI